MDGGVEIFGDIKPCDMVAKNASEAFQNESKVHTIISSSGSEEKDKELAGSSFKSSYTAAVMICNRIP